MCSAGLHSAGALNPRDRCEGVPWESGGDEKGSDKLLISDKLGMRAT